ncbi:hypothetical protein K6025_04825 [Ehrlichia sp. JZT12]
MLYSDLKQGVIVNYKTSHFGSFLRSHGFSGDDILTTLVICKSFHQNVLSYVVYNKGKVFNRISNDHVEIEIHDSDPRNYLGMGLVFSELGQHKQLSQAGQINLKASQVYFLYMVYTHIFKYILSKKYSTCEEIVDELINSVENAIDHVFDSLKLVAVDKKDVIPLFLNIVNDIDNKKLRTKLLEMVKKSESCYLSTIRDLEEDTTNDVLSQVVVSVAYKQFIEHFIAINDHTLSQQFKDKIFSMTLFFEFSIYSIA